MRHRANTQTSFLACIFLTTAVFSWAVNTVLAKGMIHDINPMALSLFRWLTALIFLVPFGYRRLVAAKVIIRQNYGKILILSIFSVTTYNSIIYFSAKYTTATNMSFVIATTPATTFLLSWLILGEKAGFIKISGMIISLFGMVLIIFKGSVANFLSMNINPGDILTYSAVCCWAVYSVLLKHFKLTIDAVAFLVIIMIFGIPFIVPFYVRETMIYGTFSMNVKTIATLLFLGIFPSIISYLCWNEGVKRAGPNTASIFMYLIPVIASIIAWIFLNERVFYYHITGGIIIFAGLFMAVRKG